MNSFGMVVYTVATASGILFCSLIPSFTVQLTTVVVCCALNGILSSKSMSPIAFRILNFTTMSILMQEFCSTKRVLSPYDVSDRLGVRMLPKEKCCEKDKSSIVYISPPVDKLVIRADRLEEDILYVSDDNMFMLSLWEADEGPLNLRECYARYEFSSFMKYVKSFPPFKYFARKEKPDPLFGRKKLTLLVHVKCPVQHLITAHLLLSVSTIQHATSETELRLFLRQCHVEQKKWQAEGVRLRKALEDVGWDVSVPALDHPNYRLTDLIIPLSLRGTAPSPQK
ncbi:hypothetical protein, conserved [Angomonas deanei]|uniref:Protein root UVB sensitive/RUS domain-containing protein n=1 Tax=Angomonas deanei TaxID=59799 RepID=A0A7G2CBC1_9TRYP|nr:hypothetical protein, conserved [Angomonas deanei]